MPRKSKRELWRALEDLEPPVGWDVTSEVTVVMDREDAEAQDREITDGVGEKTRVATVTNSEGDVIGGSPETKIPDSVDLVEVTPE